jgi:hypothetical protein
MYPAYLGIFIMAAVLTVPFYFFNKFLLRRIQPGQSGKKLLLYFLIIAVNAFVYITTGIYLVIKAVKQFSIK